MISNIKYDKNKVYIVGVSGGPDSMALLNMLYEEGYNLVTCLVNYNTRKEKNQCINQKIVTKTKIKSWECEKYGKRYKYE